MVFYEKGILERIDQDRLDLDNYSFTLRSIFLRLGMQKEGEILSKVFSREDFEFIDANLQAIESNLLRKKYKSDFDFLEDLRGSIISFRNKISRLRGKDLFSDEELKVVNSLFLCVEGMFLIREGEMTRDLFFVALGFSLIDEAYLYNQRVVPILTLASWKTLNLSLSPFLKAPLRYRISLIENSMDRLIESIVFQVSSMFKDQTKS